MHKKKSILSPSQLIQSSATHFPHIKHKRSPTKILLIISKKARGLLSIFIRTIERMSGELFRIVLYFTPFLCLMY